MSEDGALERACRDLRARTPAWDDLRERRVLGRIEAQIDVTRAARRSIAARAMPWVAAAALIMLCLTGWVLLRSLTTPEMASVTVADDIVAVTPSNPPAIPAVAAPALVLADGSVVSLGASAEVNLREQAANRIVIEHRSGRVHYDVRPGLPRAFVVAAADVEVTVVGTAFWIARDAGRVRVTVEHGRVEVARAGTSPTVLTAGDELELTLGPDQAAAPRVPAPDPAGSSRVSARPRRRAPEPSATARPTLDDLLAAADDARARGDATRAAALLQELVDRFSEDPRAYGPCFQLGKVERIRGRHSAAATAFARAVGLAPSGSLSEDARAEAALSWFDAGRFDRARAAADDYLGRYPDGAHVARVRRMLDQLP